MKLSTKSTIIFGIAGILTLTASGFFVYTSTKSALQKNIEEKQLLIGRQAMDQIDRLLYSYYLGIQSIAEEEHIERTLSGALTDKRVIQRRIKELPFLTGPWDIISIVDLQGGVVVSNVEGNQKKDPDELLAIGKALKGDAYYSDFIISKETGKPTMIFAAPIRDQETIGDPIVGVAVGQIAWPAVSQILLNFDPVNTVNVYNNEGSLIATNQETPANLFIKNDKIIDQIKNVDDLTSKIEKSEDGFEALITHVNSIGYLAYKGNGWSLFIETPTSITFAPAVNTAQNIVLILLPIIVSIVGLLFIIFRRLIVNPIVDFTKITDLIARGDLTKRVVIKSGDEIGNLGSSFNKMTSQLYVYQKNLEEKISQLQEEHSRFTASVNSLQLGFIAVDRSGNIIAINPTGLKIFGLQSEGTSIAAIADQVGKSFDLRYYYQRCILEKTQFDIKEIEYGPRFMRIFLAPIIIAAKNDEVIGAVILVEDITEHKIMERSKDEFFSIASHELRTPLTAIRGNASMLNDFYKDKISDKDAQEMINDMHAASERLIRIVNDFLDVSRLEQGKIEFKKEKFDVLEVIRNTIKEYSGNATSKKIGLKFEEFGKEVPMVLGDKDRVKQVLVNLVGNAINYTKEGSVGVYIELGKEFVKVCVKDTGLGIQLKNQSLLFRKFQQAGESTITRDVTQGTGLGLYISKLLIESMGGVIKLESSEFEKGSVFSFSLPLAQ